VTMLGKALDPIADKICVLSITLFLIIKDRIPFHFLIFVMARDLTLALMNIYLMNLKSFVTGTNIIGKTSVVMVALTLIAAIYKLEPFRDIFMIISYFFLLISFVQYSVIFVKNFGKTKANL
jgi:CDP-diacylglycerol--glycerol-3-phosphate 3-phosphatidyltransferase